MPRKTTQQAPAPGRAVPDTAKTTVSRDAAPKTTAPKASSRPKPPRTIPVQAAPHVRTLANGEPRPKSRRSK